MQNFSEVKTNLLSGLTVALAMVPEAIAFALIAQVSPLTGLYAAILVCFITSVFGGRPGMVSSPAWTRVSFSYSNFNGLITNYICLI
jgi:SulP family sulfate permease